MTRKKKDNANEELKEIAQDILEGKELHIPNNRYPETIKLLAINMRARGYSLRDVCTELNIASHETIRTWEKDSKLVTKAIGKRDIEDVKNILISKQYRNANIFTDMAVDDAKLDKMSAFQLQTMAGIAIDKANALQGKNPNAFDINITLGNITDVQKDISAYEKELAEIDKQIIDIEGTITDVKEDNNGVTV